MMDNELKKKVAAFIKANLTGDFMSEEDIIWIIDECDKGHKLTYDDFVKARRQPKVIESKDICCSNCKHSILSIKDDPCKRCLELDIDQPLGMRHECFEKKDIVDAKDPSMNFGPNMMREEEFKIPDSIRIMLDQNRKPSLVIPQLDGIKEDIKTYHDDTEKYLTSFSDWLVRIETKSNTIKSHQINLEKANQAIEYKIDKLTGSLQSVDAKLDILDKRLNDLREHQIMKGRILDRSDEKLDDMQKDILEKLNNIEQVVMKNSIGINTTYEKASAVHDEVFKDETKDISSAKEPPKFKVGDIVKVTNDTKHRDFFVCKIKWSDRFNRWSYLLSENLDDISGSFWKFDDWLIKSEDDISPLFNVGDKVKLKHGKVVYEVYSITYFMHNKKKVYRYKIGHSASTTHYENENRLIKA